MCISTWTDDFPYFDGHCDTLTAMDGRYGRICLQLEKEKYSRRGQIFAICGDISPRPMDNIFKVCLERFSRMDGVSLCRNSDEFLDAQSKGKCASILAIEGAEVIDCDSSRLEEVCNLGVKVIAPTWNIFNGLCGTAAESVNTGLTCAGVEFCDKAVSLGILLDVSHASEAAAFEMVKRYPGNVFASHSNSYAVCPNRRNISDELFCAIAESGGTVGINLYAPFVSQTDADLGRVADHICHFAELTPLAFKSISLGFDLDGCDHLPKGMSTSCDAHLLAYELSCRGFDKQSIIDIFHDNLFGFIWKGRKYKCSL